MNRKHYNESERLALLREYYSSGLSKYAFIKKHNLSGSAILNKWNISVPLKWDELNN